MPELSAARDGAVGFLRHLFGQVAEQGMTLFSRQKSASTAQPALGQIDLVGLARLLLTSRGEASGVAIAREIMQRYLALAAPERIGVLQALARDFAPDAEVIRAAFAAYDKAPNDETLAYLNAVVEPPRQEILRRLNLAPGNTAGLVKMREDLLDALPKRPELKALDRDFIHLFSSWFNRGFLMLKRIDWQSPAHILEKIIKYEAVHAIRSWDDLRRRIDPADRRCYAFFHPALQDEPLIFVEVALMEEIPSAIEPILTEGRAPLQAERAKVAVFYSISNCQRGLNAISFGHFLIKQVVEELKRELPQITTFVTLSPVPGFRKWVESEMAKPESPFIDAEARAVLLDENIGEHDDAAMLRAASERLLARYFLDVRDARGRVVDPVARFHLGNGARLERLNPLADFSEKGWRDSYAAMVNYLYDLPSIEENHEQFAIRGVVVASNSVQKTLAEARAFKPKPEKPVSRAS